MWPKKRRTSKSRAELEGYRSGLEGTVADQYKAAGEPVEYEKYSLRYTKPAKEHRYTPDFVQRNGIVVETKGRFVTADRQKHLAIQACHPHLDIRFVFSNPNQKIGKKSSTTYAMWCEKHGFQYAARLVPTAWIKEPPVPSRVRAATQALGWQP
jgi:hypothetical protein